MEMMTQNKHLDWKDLCDYGSVVKKIVFPKVERKAIFNVTVRSNATV